MRADDAVRIAPSGAVEPVGDRTAEQLAAWRDAGEANRSVCIDATAVGPGGIDPEASPGAIVEDGSAGAEKKSRGMGMLDSITPVSERAPAPRQ